MQNTLLIKSLQKTIRLYAVISKINDMILHVSDKNEIFLEACRIAVQEGKFQMSWIGILDEKTGLIVPEHWAGNENEYFKCIEKISAKNIPSGRGPTGSAIREGLTFIVNDIANDQRVEIWREEALKRNYASSIAIPIIVKAKTIGVFTIYSSEVNFFNPTEVQQLVTVTQNIAFALETVESKISLKLAEEEIIAKNNFIKTITDAMPGIVGYWTEDLVCLFANKAYVAWFEKDIQDLTGIHLSDLLDGELFCKNQPFIQGALEGKIQQFERQITRSNGKVEHILAQFVPHFEGHKVMGFFVLGSNITKMKTTEQLLQDRAIELEQTYSKYHFLWGDMNEGVQIISFDYRYLFLNNASAKQGKKTKEELIGFTMMEKYPGIEKTDVFTKIQISMEKRIVQTCESQFLFSDGTVEWFEIRISPIAEGVLILSLDITERKKIANDLIIAKKSNEEERLFEASRMSALGYMASGIAHEINNPLAIILMKISQLNRRYELGTLDQAVLGEGLTKIASTAKRIGKVVKGLSSISRNSENDPMEKFKIATMIEETLQLCQERFNGHSIKLSSDLSEISDIEIEGRASQIMQVLLNLLNNALDAVLYLDDMWVIIKASPSESNAIITVTDSGSGISDQLLAKIMKPFFTTKDAGKGTGLGLSISKRIIDEHQGQFYFKKNSPNTCFVIELPYVQNK